MKIDFNTNWRYLPSENWIVLVDGKPVVMHSGKGVWKRKNHASCALTNHLEGELDSIMMDNGISPEGKWGGFTYKQRGEFWGEVVKPWRKEHVEVVRLEDYQKRNH